MEKDIDIIYFNCSTCSKDFVEGRQLARVGATAFFQVNTSNEGSWCDLKILKLMKSHFWWLLCSTGVASREQCCWCQGSQCQDFWVIFVLQLQCQGVQIAKQALLGQNYWICQWFFKELYSNQQVRLEEGGEVSHEISIVFLSQKMSVILDISLIVLPGDINFLRFEGSLS